MTYKTQLICFTSSLHKLVYDCGLSQEKLNAIGESVNDFIYKIRLLARAISQVDLAQEIHRAIDEYIATQRRESDSGSKPIRCETGCTHCCRQAVACSPPEAALIQETVQGKGIALDYDKLRRQAGRNDQTWLQQPIEDRTCIFLGADGLCQIYEHRPASCRKYFAISPPDLCNIERYPSQEVAVWFALEAELLTTALFTECGCEFLPDLLLKGVSNDKV